MKPNQKILRPLCSVCNKEMRFVEGDIIFGDKWFHRNCAHFSQVQKFAPIEAQTE